MSFRGTFISVFLIVLFLAGCGGGTSGDQRAAQSQTQVLNLSVQLIQRQARDYVAQSAQPENQFASVIATLEQDSNVVNSAQVAVAPGVREASLTLQAVPAGTYMLTVRGVNADGQELAQDSTIIEVFPGQITAFTMSLIAGEIDVADPVARDISYLTAPGETLNVTAAEGVLSNDTTDGGTASLISGPTQGTLELEPDGSFTYTSNTDAVGFDTFVYQLNDPRGTDQATVTLNFGIGRGFFVQAGSTGTGQSAEDPRPDLDGAAAEAQPGDTIFVLFSNQPLAPGGGAPSLLTLQDQVAVIGIPQGVTPRGHQEAILGQTGGQLPEVRFQFQAGNNSRFESLRLVGIEDAPPLLNLSEKQNSTLENLELVSPETRVRFDDFTGSLTLRNCRFIESNVPEPNTLPSDFVGTLRAGQTTVRLVACELDEGTTFLVFNAFGNTLEIDIRDSSLSGNALFSAAQGSRLDVVVEDCDFVTNRLDVQHGSGGHGDTTVRRIRTEDTVGVFFRSFDQTPDALGGNILVQCVEGSGGIVAFFTFDSGRYDLVVADNVVDDFQVIRPASISITTRFQARVRALIENNTMPFALNSISAECDLDLAIVGNVVGTASSTDAPNPNDITTERLREIRSAGTFGASSEDRICLRLQGNRVGPPGDLGRIQLSVPFANPPALLLVENLADLQNNNEVNEVDVGSHVVDAGEEGEVCNPPAYPGPCD